VLLDLVAWPGFETLLADACDARILDEMIPLIVRGAPKRSVRS